MCVVLVCLGVGAWSEACSWPGHGDRAAAPRGSSRRGPCRCSRSSGRPRRPARRSRSGGGPGPAPTRRATASTKELGPPFSAPSPTAPPSTTTPGFAPRETSSRCIPATAPSRPPASAPPQASPRSPRRRDSARSPLDAAPATPQTCPPIVEPRGPTPHHRSPLDAAPAAPQVHQEWGPRPPPPRSSKRRSPARESAESAEWLCRQLRLSAAQARSTWAADLQMVKRTRVVSGGGSR